MRRSATTVSCAPRVVQVCDAVGETRSEMQQRHRRFATHASVAVRRARAHRFVQTQNGADVGVRVERADDPHLRRAWVCKTHLDARAHRSFDDRHGAGFGFVFCHGGVFADCGGGGRHVYVGEEATGTREGGWMRRRKRVFFVRRKRGGVRRHRSRDARYDNDSERFTHRHITARHACVTRTSTRVVVALHIKIEMMEGGANIVDASCAVSEITSRVDT